MSLRFALFLAPLLCSATLAFAQDRYISVSGSDSNNGTSITTPWRTLTHAADVSPSGSRINVGPGTYGTSGNLEGIEVKLGKKLSWHGAGMGKTIVLANAGFARSIQYYYASGSTTVSYTAVFVVHGTGSLADIWDMTLDANHLSAPTRLACAVYANGGSGLLKRVEMRNAGALVPDGNQRHVGMIANGTNTGATSSVTLADCNIHGWNKAGVVIGGKRLTCTVQNSIIAGSGRMGAGTAAQNGIQILDGGNNLLIRDNVIRDIWYLPTTWNSVGILNLRSNTTTTISGNSISGCKTGYYHQENPAGMVNFTGNDIASCQWGIAAYSNRLNATGNDIDANIGVYVGGSTSPTISGNYYSDFRSNAGYPSKYVADGNSAVQDTSPVTSARGNKPASTINLGAGSGPEDLVTGDFNADGKIDFAVANGGSNKVSIYFGSGGTDFSTISPKNVAVPGHPILLASGEFTGTTGQDLVVLSQTGKAYVLKNNGTGSFSLGAAFQVLPGTDDPSSIAAGDIDSFNETDFIVGYRGNGASNGGIKVCYVNSSVISAGLSLSGTTRSIEDVALTDINADTKVDIQAVDTANTSGTNNKLQVWLHAPLSTNYGAMVSYSIGAEGRGLALGDLDKDGDMDAAVARTGSENGWVHILEGQGGTSPTGTFAEAALSPFRIDKGAYRVQMLDLQDDADPDTRRFDLVVTHPTKSKMSRLRRWVDGHFESYRGAFTGIDPRGFAFAKLDSNQLPDLILALRGDHVVKVSLDDADALYQSYGVGGAGSAGRIPEIFVSEASALPIEGSNKFALEVRGVRGFSAGVFLFSADPLYSTSPCQLQVSFLSLFWLPAVATDRHGNASFPLWIPVDPNLLGVDFYAQLATYDPLACFINSFSLTQGVRIRIGH